jgi:flagellar motility protein MotE (MotC chaperone)
MMNLKDISIIPVMVLVALMSFSLKAVDVYSGLNTLSSQAYAAPEEKPEEEGAKQDDTVAESAEAQAEPTEETPETPDMDAPPAVQPEQNDKVALPKWRDANDEDFGYNSVKMENLQSLEQRRQELEQGERELQTREALLMAAQQEMDRKYQELTQIRGQLEELLEQQSEQEQGELIRLVKIYENMKAKEAAEIFNTLDMDILVDVLGTMSERKASPILAKMNPERAKAVTIMLAERKTLPSLPGNL